MTRVFDASVLVKLVVDEPGSRSAVSAYAQTDRALSPNWSLVECAQALWKKYVKESRTPEDVAVAFAALEQMALDTPETEPLIARALSLALRLRHPVYDCLYLALALEERAALVTADARLRDAAERVGVDVLWIDSAP